MLADKYCLDKLKALAHEKLSDAVGKYYNSENSLEAAREICEIELLAPKTVVVEAFARKYKELFN